MGEHSKIEWTTHTFNIVWGCVKVSPACDHCYAETFAKRVGFRIWGKDTERRTFGEEHWAQPFRWNKRATQRGERERVFCGSMCDVMEDRRDLDEWRAKLYGVIEQTPALDWLLLTKRPQNFRRFLPEAWVREPRPNVRGMATVESAEYLWRAEALLETPFQARGLSVEPLLGPLDLRPYLGPGKIDWVILGGESGPGARPMQVEWLRGVVEQCREAGAAAFVKQLGVLPVVPLAEGEQPTKRQIHRAPEGFQRLLLNDAKGGDISEFPADLQVRELPA